MNKKFSTKKKRIKLRFFFTFLMLLLGIYASYKNIEKKRIVLTDKELTNLIVDNSFTSNDSKFIANIIDKIADVTNPIKVLNSKYQTTSTFKEEKKVESPPIIYLYNSHQQEEYASSTLAEYSITPTVIMNNYILEDIFNKNN